jgi:hypothetical protein
MQRIISIYFQHSLTILRFYVFGKGTKCNIVSLKKQQKDNDKWQNFKLIKVSLFAGMKFSNENIFSVIRDVLVP